MGLTHPGIQFGHCLNDVEARARGPFGVVFVRLRIAKIDQDSVTHVTSDESLVVLDRFPATVLESGNDVAQIFRIHLGGEGRGSDQIAKHYRELPALGLRRVCGQRFIRFQRSLGGRLGKLLWLNLRCDRGVRLRADPLPGPYESRFFLLDREPPTYHQLIAKVRKLLVIQAELALQVPKGKPAFALQEKLGQRNRQRKVHRSPLKRAWQEHIRLYPRKAIQFTYAWP